MNREFDTVGRLAAWGQRRAVLIRRTSSIAPDPEQTYAIGLIRLVGEERIQSIAYGVFGEFPSASVSTNPLDRDVTFLEPFARSLDAYVRGMLAQSLLPRIWIANEATRDCLALLGARFRANRHASEIIRTLGRLCMVITADAEYAGAQILVTSVSLLTEHVRTGQSPLQDYSLGAVLAWISPEPDAEPWIVADRRSRKPSAAVMHREDDDGVEQLRDRTRRARKRAERLRGLAQEIEAGSGERGEEQGQLDTATLQAAKLREHAMNADNRANEAQRVMANILSEAAIQEYSDALEANMLFWSLPLLPCPGVERLVAASLQRLTEALNSDSGLAAEPHTLAMDLASREHAITLTESIFIGGDDLIREQARLQGRVVKGVVLDVRQPRSHRRPCALVMSTEQTVLRIRPNTQLRIRGTGVVGRVSSVSEDAASGDTFINLELTAGLRHVPSIGEEIDADDAVLYGAAHRAHRVYYHMARTRPPLVYGELPAPTPRHTIPTGDLLAVARGLRRPI